MQSKCFLLLGLILVLAGCPVDPTSDANPEPKKQADEHHVVHSFDGLHFQGSQPHLMVVVASYNNEKFAERNLISILDQDYTNFHVYYVNDASTDNTRLIVEKLMAEHPNGHRVTLINNMQNKGSHVENQYFTVKEHSRPNDIVVIVDGDDALANPQVLTNVAKVYSNFDVYLTHGTFINTHGQKGHSTPVPVDVIDANGFRQFEFVQSHLRTFYAWLFLRIPEEDLKYQGRFVNYAGDVMEMMPMCELAGRHISYLAPISYLYNQENPISDFRTSSNQVDEVYQDIIHRQPYKPLSQDDVKIRTQKRFRVAVLVRTNGAESNQVQKTISFVQHSFLRRHDVSVFTVSDAQPLHLLGEFDYWFVIDANMVMKGEIGDEILGDVVGVRNLPHKVTSTTLPRGFYSPLFYGGSHLGFHKLEECLSETGLDSVGFDVCFEKHPPSIVVNKFFDVDAAKYASYQKCVEHHLPVSFFDGPSSEILSNEALHAEYIRAKHSAIGMLTAPFCNLKAVAYDCSEQGCGGHGDRVNGFVSSFAFALLGHYHFAFSWTHPVDVESYYEMPRAAILPNYSNWLGRRVAFNLIDDNEFFFPGQEKGAQALIKALDHADLLVMRYNLKAWHQLVSNPLNHQSARMYGLLDLDEAHQFRLLSSIFFSKPKPVLQQAVDQELARLPSRQDTPIRIGVHIRTGGNRFFDRAHEVATSWRDPPRHRVESIPCFAREAVKLCQQLDTHARCAYFLATDASLARSAFREALLALDPSAVLVWSDDDPLHHDKVSTRGSIPELVQVWLPSYTDWQMLREMDGLVISRSGFSETVAWMKQVPYVAMSTTGCEAKD